MFLKNIKIEKTRRALPHLPVAMREARGVGPGVWSVLPPPNNGLAASARWIVGGNSIGLVRVRLAATATRLTRLNLKNPKCKWGTV